MKKYLPFAVVVVAIAAVVALAVGNKDENSSTTPPPPPTSTEPTTNGSSATSETTQPQAASSVNITDFNYSPATLTVKKGTTVTWTNNDSVAHTVTAESGEGPKSKLFGKGETYSYTFNSVGTFDYFCEPHPNMKGKVIVTE